MVGSERVGDILQIASSLPITYYWQQERTSNLGLEMYSGLAGAAGDQELIG